MPERRQVLLQQAEMIQRSNFATVPEEADRHDVQRVYHALLTVHDQLKISPESSRTTQATH
jgi:hypothetical protein